MNKFKNRNGALALFFAIASTAIMLFIFYQSLKSIGESSVVSGRLSAQIQPIVDPQYRVPQKVFHHYIRKFAHFAEFSALGFCIGGFSVNFGRCLERRMLALPIGIVLFVALMDEFLQLFTGRGSAFKDVILDFGGGLFGLLTMSVICLICKKLFQKH